MMWLLTQLALAGPVDFGAAMGLAGVRTSSGQHPLRLGLDLWYRKGLGDGMHLEAELWTSSLSDPAPQVGTIDTRLVKPSLMVGWHGGTTKTRVGFSVGPSVTVLAGGLGGDQLLLRGGLRGKIDLRVPLGEGWALVSHAGLGTRRTSGDVDLMVGLARRF